MDELGKELRRIISSEEGIKEEIEEDLDEED